MILTALKDLLQDGKLVDLNRAIGLSLLGLLAAATCVFVFTRRVNLVFVLKAVYISFALVYLAFSNRIKGLVRASLSRLITLNHIVLLLKIDNIVAILLIRIPRRWPLSSDACELFIRIDILPLVLHIV